MTKLTKEQREFRRIGAVVPFSKLWPGVALIVAIGMAALYPDLYQQCTEHSFSEGEGKGEGRVRAFILVLTALPCSPFLLKGGFTDWALFAAIWAPIPFIFLNLRWYQRYKAYWQEVQNIEREARTKKEVS